MRSIGKPPKTMPPRRPLPIGSASSQRSAGLLYQSSSLGLLSVAGCAVATRESTPAASAPCRKLRLVAGTRLLLDGLSIVAGRIGPLAQLASAPGIDKLKRILRRNLEKPRVRRVVLEKVRPIDLPAVRAVRIVAIVVGIVESRMVQ